jgi:hypothetical protein
MPIPALLGLAALTGASSLASNIGKSQQTARDAATLADRERLAREQAVLERARLQRAGQADALGTRLGYLSGAQSQEQSLAAQRLNAMGLGQIQDFERQQALREGMSDVAQNYDPTATAASPLAKAMAGRAPNMAKALTGQRYRESVGAGRTQESIQDYLARVNELRRDPNLDAESRAALDRVEALMGQELPGITGQASRPSGMGAGGVIAAILGAGAAGLGSYLANTGGQGEGGGMTSFNNRMPYTGVTQGLSGNTVGPTGMPTNFRLPTAQFAQPELPGVRFAQPMGNPFARNRGF